ncbi:unnamed protein product [marine sediment metagenome]|uniref:Uncharacterized protein n=1 Tax=marine sediment metagenome TaxID=412755 RepID=X1HFZ7_9ZZZZ
MCKEEKKSEEEKPCEEEEPEEEEKLWTAEVIVTAKAITKEEAEEKIKAGYVLVDDILELKLETMDHLEGEFRKKMTQKIFRALQHREQHPSASIW